MIVKFRFVFRVGGTCVGVARVEAKMLSQSLGCIRERGGVRSSSFVNGS